MPLEHPQRGKKKHHRETGERERERERERELTKLHKLLNPTENQNLLQKNKTKQKLLQTIPKTR
jgi:hypothetical protein